MADQQGNFFTYLSTAPVLATLVTAFLATVLILINYWFPDLLSLG